MRRVHWWRRLVFRIPALVALSGLAAAVIAGMLMAAPGQAGTSLLWSLGVGMVVAILGGAAAMSLMAPLSRVQAMTEQLLLDPEALTEVESGLGSELDHLAQQLHRVLSQSLQRQHLSQDMLARLEAVLQHARVGVAFSRSSRLELVSRHFCQVFKYEPAQVIGQATRIMYASEEAYAALSARAHPAFLRHGAFEGELELVRSNGEPFWAHMRGSAVVPGNLTAGTIWIIEDVTRAREQRESLTWSANHDALTGLANRTAFEAALGKSLASHKPFSSLFMDLDRFKEVNDSSGHAAGDALLKGLADCLSEVVRRSDTVARLGGDEFAVLLPGCPAERALAVAEKLRLAVETFALDWQGQEHRVGVSVGLVHAAGEFTTPAEVLRAADAACYASKHAGRNRVTSFHDLSDEARAHDKALGTQAGAAAALETSISN